MTKTVIDEERKRERQRLGKTETGKKSETQELRTKPEIERRGKGVGDREVEAEKQR